MKEQAQVEELIKEGGKVYLPPCQIACPIGEDIQRTNVMISLLPMDADKCTSKVVDIGNEIYEKNPLFTICSYICGLCEKECNYKDQTGAVRRKMLKRFVSDYFLASLDSKPALPTPTKDKVAVVGGGPGGLMCAYMLGKKGYQVTIMDRGPQLGGAVRYIPQYRLPKKILDSNINNMMRIANVEIKLDTTVGDDGKTMAALKEEGYRAIFIATGTPVPRPLTIGREVVAGADLEGVSFGLNLLWEANLGSVSPKLYKGKKVIVVGGGNVAFDVARTARRLGGDVSLVCLESKDKSSKDGIPADLEEIEGATQEGIKITYSRGVQEISGDKGKFKKIKCPRCTSVFEEDGRFNPQFDMKDMISLKGDVLLVTIGQGPERALPQKEDLLNDKGRLDVDPLTLMSNRKEGIFIGGDMRRVGFAAEAMKDGVNAAESIDRFLKGEDLKAGREKEYESADIPALLSYKPQPELVWKSAKERLNFDTFEKGLTLKEAIDEAQRCLCCGPCKSCKGCVVLELQEEIAAIEVNQDLCSGCGVCVAVCPFDAISLGEKGEGLVSTIDDLKCKRCGLCVTACPSGAVIIQDGFKDAVVSSYATL